VTGRPSGAARALRDRTGYRLCLSGRDAALIRTREILSSEVKRGWTVAQIAADVGCGETTITDGCRNTPSGNKEPDGVQIDKDELARLVEAGWVRSGLRSTSAAASRRSERAHAAIRAIDRPVTPDGCDSLSPPEGERGHTPSGERGGLN
jgi:hypothetical protein